MVSLLYCYKVIALIYDLHGVRPTVRRVLIIGSQWRYDDDDDAGSGHECRC